MTMRNRPIRMMAIASFVALLGAHVASAQWTERTVETVRTTEVQVLTSGPVHEAFAETVVNDPEPDLVVLQPPPGPLNEEPPDMVPDGPNMTWIPGYWAWDDDRDDYLWVSGIWRSVPPGRSYVPGFWTRVGHGYQWASGFWVDADAMEIEYLPEPPEPVETGPPPPSPAPNLIWTPGTWVWDQDRYVWRPGHWVEASPDWIWIPAHFVWGPRGYVFVDGYWDYPVEDRGVLFAPVYVSPRIRTTHFVYAPATVIDLEIFTEHLFVRPRYRHYYFGDYYAVGYIDKGIYPWHSVHARRVGYDPIFAYRRWRHRDEPDWERRIELSFHRRRDNERERPPRTFDLQVNLGDRGEAGVKGFVVAKTLQQAMQNQNRKLQFRAVDRSERDVIVQRAKEATKSRETRKTIESQEAGAAAEPVKRTTPVREKMPVPTVSAKKDATTKKGPAPKKPDAPTVDRSVAPKPKQKVEKVTREQKAPEQPAAQPSRPQPAPAPPQPTPRPAPKPDKPDEKARPAEPSKERGPDTDKPKGPPPEKSKKPEKDDDEAKSKSKKKEKDKDDP